MNLRRTVFRASKDEGLISIGSGKMGGEELEIVD